MIIDLMKQPDIVSFSSNYVPESDSLLDQLFPNVKTDNIELAWTSFGKDAQAIMAMVHAFDTEAELGTIPDFNAFAAKKFLIKEKIPFGEELEEKLANYRDSAVVKQQIYNIMKRTSDDVRMRTLVMKGDLLSTGKITINENHINETVPMGVKDTQLKTTDWDSASAKIEDDIVSYIDALAASGYKATRAVTSRKYMLKIAEALRTNIVGTTGARPTISQTNDYLEENYGIRIATFDAMYRYRNGKTITQKRYIPEDKFILFGGDRSEAVGRGFYGVTPEERKAKLDVRTSNNVYIMNTIWEEPDPATTWTKASAVFVPVLADPANLIIATV